MRACVSILSKCVRVKLLLLHVLAAGAHVYCVCVLLKCVRVKLLSLHALAAGGHAYVCERSFEVCVCSFCLCM